MIALAAEFPNDNPALHDGVIWVCLDPVGAPIAVREAAPAPAELPHASEPDPLVVAAPIAVEPPDRRAAPRGDIAPEIVAAPEIAAVASEIAVVGPEIAAAVPEIAVAELDDVAEKLAEVAARLESVARAQSEASPTMAGASPMMTGASPTMADASARDDEREAAPPRASGIIAIARDDDEADDEPIVVEELEPIEAIAEVAAPEAPAAVSADDPFVQLCGIMADIARASDAPVVASALPKLLLEGALDPAIGAEALAALVEGGFASGAEPTPALTATIAAWRSVLSGASDDLSACGGATLDEWAADLLARLLGSASKASTVRRELRSRGVAAFGLLEAA